MVINAEKTKIMLITTTRQKWRYLDTTDPGIWIKGDKLLVVESEKLLLCHFQQGTHFITVTFHHMDYCSTILGNAPSSERVLKLQKRVARIITDAEYRAKSYPLMKQLHWLPLPEHVKYRQMKTDCQKEHGKQKRVAEEEEEDQSCDGKTVSNEMWKEQVQTAQSGRQREMENSNNESRRSNQVTWTPPRKGKGGRRR